MIELTPAEALEIQARHLAHYEPRHTGISERIRARTDVRGLDLNTHYPVTRINRHIPRGGQIEHEIARMQQQP